MFGSSWLMALCASVAAFAVITANAETLDERTARIVDAFTDDDILGQMTQLNIDTIMNDAKTAIDEAKVREFARLKVGSYLNSPFAGGAINGKYGWTATEWRAAMTRIQQISMETNGGHPIIFGIDSVHGANYVLDATIFGQQLNAGAAFNLDLVFKMGQITGRDTVAAGIPWIFGPILELAQNPMWARTYETFGEDPHLVSIMGAAIIQGIQNNTAVAACMKHFVGYSKLVTGKDRDAVTLSDFDLLNYFAPPFIAAVQAGVMTAMENYISINGVPTVMSAKLMKDLLRYDLGFEGFIVTDWEEINNLHTFHRVAKSLPDAVRLALTRTTIDMSMVPNNADFIGYAKMMLTSYPQFRARLKESARRIVKTKLALGLYDTPVPGAAEVPKVGQKADRDVALELARESIVLLQNKDNVLPLANTAKVLLTGHSAHNIGNLCGGWTLRWQGSSGNDQYPNGISVQTAMKAAGGSAVTSYNGHDPIGDDMYNPTKIEANFAEIVRLAQGVEYVVAVIGENPYTEKPGDINDLALPSEQVALVNRLVTTGKKIILVLVGGRPRLLGDLPGKVHGIINAMLPGELGGQAIADVIYGKTNPSGRLPLTYHKHQGNILIPYNRPVTTSCDKNACEVQWPFGHGLSYSTFVYSQLRLSKTTVTGDADSLTVTVKVENQSPTAGKETVILFLTQPFREIAVPEVKMLKKFQKIQLAGYGSATVTFTLTSADWSVYDPQIGNGFLRTAENGDFIVSIKPDTTCNPYDANMGSTMCARFKLEATVSTVTMATDETDGAGRVIAFNG